MHVIVAVHIYILCIISMMKYISRTFFTISTWSFLFIINYWLLYDHKTYKSASYMTRDRTAWAIIITDRDRIAIRIFWWATVKILPFRNCKIKCWKWENNFFHLGWQFSSFRYGIDQGQTEVSVYKWRSVLPHLKSEMKPYLPMILG